MEGQWLAFIASNQVEIHELPSDWTIVVMANSSNGPHTGGDTRQITFADTRSACDVISFAHKKSRYTSPWGVSVRKRHWRVPTHVIYTSHYNLL